MSETLQRPSRPGLSIALDYGPLIAFFLSYNFASGPALVRLLIATVVFMVAIVMSMIVSVLVAKRIPPIMLLTAVIVLVFGGLSLYFHDARFIQMKPTILYGILAAVLGFGLLTGKPLLQMVLAQSFPGLTPLGWRKLTINWMLFFVGLAITNEIVRLNFSETIWVYFKTWGVVPLALLFGAANLPMLFKHGLELEDPAPVPPEG